MHARTNDEDNDAILCEDFFVGQNWKTKTTKHFLNRGRKRATGAQSADFWKCKKQGKGRFWCLVASIFWISAFPAPQTRSSRLAVFLRCGNKKVKLKEFYEWRLYVGWCFYEKTPLPLLSYYWWKVALILHRIIFRKSRRHSMTITPKTFWELTQGCMYLDLLIRDCWKSL